MHRLPSVGRDSSQSGLTWEILRGDTSLIDALEDEWNSICDSGRFHFPFLRAPLVRAYVSAFAPGSTLVIPTARHDGRLVALLPLVERTDGSRRLGLRWLRSAGNRHFPLLDVISSHENPEQIAQELWGVLSAIGTWDVLQIDTVPIGGIADRMRVLASRDGYKTYLHHPEEGPYISIPEAATLDGLINKQRKSLRKQLRRDLRRLQEIGEIGLVEAGSDGDRDCLMKAYHQFVDMEHRSWKGEEGSSLRHRPAVNAFYKHLIDDPNLEGLLRVHTLTCNGVPVAVAMGLVSGTTLFSLRITFRSDYGSYSPGHLLILHQLHALRRQGFDTLDLGGGMHTYKLAWASTTMSMGYPFIFGKSIPGSVAYAVMFWMWPRLRPALNSGWLGDVARRVMS